MSEQMKKKCVCIKIFKDDTFLVTNEEGKPLKPMSKPKPIVGPANTYQQALWYNENPTCVWIGGKQY